MAAGLPARRDPCGEQLRQATLVDFRGSNLSDAGSIPAISTLKMHGKAMHFLLNRLCSRVSPAAMAGGRGEPLDGLVLCSLRERLKRQGVQRLYPDLQGPGPGVVY